MSNSAQERAQAKLAEEEKFLKSKPEDLVDAGAIKRSAFLGGLGDGALKGLMVGAIGVGVLGALIAGGIVSGGIITMGLTWLGISSGVVPVGTMLALAAGAVGLSTAVGAITGAGKAMAEGDEKVEEEVGAMRRKQQVIAQRRLQRREMEINRESQEIELQKQSLAMGVSPSRLPGTKLAGEMERG